MRCLRRILGLLGVLVLAGSLARVAWRSLAPALGEEATVLRVMHWSGEGGPEEDAIVADQIRAFEASHPGVRVERINAGDPSSFYTKLQTMMAAGDPPDLFYLEARRVPAFADQGLLAPLEPWLERPPEAGEPALSLEDFYPVVADAFRFDGRRSGQGPLYGLPKDFTTIGFYANLDLLEAAGVTPPDPEEGWTWEEFHAAARAVGALEGVTGAEFVTWPMMVRLYLATEGLEVADPGFQEVLLDEPEALAALERLASWRHEEENTLTSGRSRVASGASVFLTGRVGLAGPFGRWVVPSYRGIRDFRWEFLPLPRGRVRANTVATLCWAMAADTPHPEEAFALLRYLVGPESQERAARLGLAVPSLRAVAESPAFLDPEQPPGNDRLYLDQLRDATVQAWPADPRFEARMGVHLDQALRSGDRSVAEAVRAFEEEWEREQASPLRSRDFPPMPWGAWIQGFLAAFFLLGLAGGFLWFRRRPGALEAAEERAGLLLVSPWLLGFLLLTAFPVVLSFLLSLTRWSGLSGLEHADYVGLANYAELLGHDERLRTSLRVTAYYALLAVPLGQAVALLLALMLQNAPRGRSFFRSALYLPSVLAGVGVAVLWRQVFDGDHGLLNAALAPLLRPLGLEPPHWLDRDAALWGPPAFALMSLWTLGGTMIVYLAGLQGIPRTLLEAAALDGYGPWGRFRRVTLPLLAPVILFNLIIGLIGSFQVFTQAYVMTGGEPGDLTRFYVLYLYNQAFDFYQMGYASAMAWLLLLLVLGLTVLVLRGGRRAAPEEAWAG